MKATTALLRKVEEKPGCVKAALEIIGDKWSGLILGDLFDNKKTFSELSTDLPGISPRTLSARLDVLEESGIITRKCYCEHPPRYQYELTDKGQDLRSILTKMADWGEKYS